MDYDTYNKSASYLSWLLTPATVCLAIPLYKQLHLLKEHGAAVAAAISAGVAASASISPSECLRCFHSTIGITPIQYLKQYRIQRAAKLLTESSMKIVDVGTECGFQEMSYFARAFRDMKGCTPSQFRKRAAAFQAETRIQGFSEKSGGREADREILPYADAE